MIPLESQIGGAARTRAPMPVTAVDDDVKPARAAPARPTRRLETRLQRHGLKRAGTG